MHSALLIIWHSAVYSTHAFFLATLSSLLQAIHTDFGYLGSKEMHWKDVWKLRLWTARHRKDKNQRCSMGCPVAGTGGQSLGAQPKWVSEPQIFELFFVCLFLLFCSHYSFREHQIDLALAVGNQSTLIILQSLSNGRREFFKSKLKH